MSGILGRVVLYGLVGKVLRGVVVVYAVLLVKQEVAGSDIGDKGRSATNFNYSL